MKIHSCLIHYSGTKGSLISFTEKRFETFFSCRKEWLKYNEISSNIANKSLDICPDGESVKNCGRFSLHIKCYNAFTDISKIKRVEQKILAKENAKNESKKEFSKEENSGSPKPKRCTQSLSSSQTQPNSSNRNVLPPVCIICKRKNSFRDTVSLHGTPVISQIEINYVIWIGIVLLFRAAKSFSGAPGQIFFRGPYSLIFLKIFSGR